MENWFLITMIEPFKEIKEIYTNEIDALVANVADTQLKDISSVNWIRVRLYRLTETIIHTIYRINIISKEFDGILRKQDYEIRSAFNSAQFRLYFRIHNWNYYGFGQFISSENMRELFHDDTMR